MRNNTIRIILAEDHTIVRDGIKMLLAQDPALLVVGEAQNGQEAINLITSGLEADIILADQNMPQLSGLEMTEKVRTLFPDIKVIILSMLDHDEYIFRAFDVGAVGYILKSVSSDEMIFALRHVYDGNRYLCTEFAIRLLDKQRNLATLNNDVPDARLSDREKEVLVLIAEGMTNQEIADRLFTSKRTVEGHRLRLLNKTGARNAAALIKYAVLNGII